MPHQHIAAARIHREARDERPPRSNSREGSDKAALTRNMRLLSLTFTASSIAGPLVAGFAMNARGSDMLMWQLALMSGALVVYTLGLREGRRQPEHSSSMS
ncbi:hypothetical protein ACFFYR_38375 [Paraburkholderia dipogonis]|uniref:hypothetical protein n=1 Tax=Paraburkholderia dipogonis TaxID=1211383 RepID=UPI0035EF5503